MLDRYLTRVNVLHRNVPGMFEDSAIVPSWDKVQGEADGGRGIVCGAADSPCHRSKVIKAASKVGLRASPAIPFSSSLIILIL